MEFGIDRFLFFGANSPSGAGVNPFPDLLEEIELADRSGIHAFGIGEHHTSEFADSSPVVLLAAAAARTSRIRLSSAITILSVADPVRVMEDFGTLDLISNGRAEIVAGRGAYAEAFSLFGGDLGEYDALYREKLELLLRLRAGDPVHWHGKFRPPLSGQTTYPRPVQAELPIWIGATKSPGSFQRAGELGLPLALGTIGGSISEYRPLLDLYRAAGRHAGHGPERIKVALHAIGYIGGTREQARTDFYPSYNAVFNELGSKAGWPTLTTARFADMTGPTKALFVGDEPEVAEKIASANHMLGGISRLCLQMTIGPLALERRLRTIERLGRLAVGEDR